MADARDDIFFATTTELNERLKSGELSAVSLTRAFADRLEKLGPRYNALALPLTEEAIRKAEEVDKDIKRGRTRGPLQGLPYGAKDLLPPPGARVRTPHRSSTTVQPRSRDWRAWGLCSSANCRLWNWPAAAVTGTRRLRCKGRGEIPGTQPNGRAVRQAVPPPQWRLVWYPLPLGRRLQVP